KSWMCREVDGEITCEFVVQPQPSEVTLAAVQPNQWLTGAADEILDARAAHSHKFLLECSHLLIPCCNRNYGVCSKGPGSPSSLPISRTAGSTSSFISCKQRIVSL